MNKQNKHISTKPSILRKQEEALLVIALWRENNLSKRAFCMREGIS